MVPLNAQIAPGAARFPTTPRAVVAIPAPPTHAPAIAAGRVYLALDSGVVVAHRLSDGAEVWRVELATEQPPVALGPFLLVTADGAVQALRGQDGSLSWRAETGVLSAPLLAHEGWVIASSAQRLFALRAEDGTVVWARENPALAARATIEGDRVYAPLADGRVQALELRTGREVWTRRLGGAPTSVLAFADSVYVGSADQHFYSLDAARGTIRWRFRVGAALRGTPAADGRFVYTVSLDNLVRAYDRDHGAMTWNKGVPFRALAGPTVLGGAVLAAGPAAQVPIFDAATGTPQSPLVFDAPLVAPVALAIDGQHRVLAAAVGSLESGWRLVLLDSSYAVPLAPLTALPGELIALPAPGK